MARYVDGFIIPVPKKNMKEYRKMAKLSAKVWVQHGALEYVETEGDEVPKGKTTSFPRSVKLKGTECVIFGYAVYKSRTHRDQVMTKVMQDERLITYWENMPFDGNRMVFGGFKTIVAK